MQSSAVKTCDRNKAIALLSLILGGTFLFQPFPGLRFRGFDVDVCLKGISLPLLIVSAILSSISFPRKLVELASIITLVLGYVCLVGPLLLAKFNFLQNLLRFLFKASKTIHDRNYRRTVIYSHIASRHSFVVNNN